MYRDSITHNFMVEGEAAVRFVEAIEKSMKMPKKPCTVKFEELHGIDEIRKFMKRRNKANG